MRSGGCSVQQTLTTEAASVLKHSLSLARRRGHAQITPLHVAVTLLSSRTSLLRRACLKSYHHHHHQPHHQSSSDPLQCRALELCFNVALNRLPTIPGSLLHHHGQPSISNALVAALKRAQAHQRRGCIEQQQQQQQPLLTIKVELEQLIISILDDPSVSRVMREAGFSSTAIKNHIEDSTTASSVFQCYSSSSNGGVFSSPCSPSSSETHHHLINYSSEQNPVRFCPQKPAPVDKEDMKLLVEVLLREKRKNTVVVGDCLSLTEALVSEFMGRVERGDVPQELKQTHVIKFHLAPVTLRFMKKEDVEMNLTELKRNVESVTSVGGGGGGGGAIIYTGDLNWTVDHQESNNNNNNFNGEIITSCYYNPINHLVSEIGKLVSDYCNRTASNTSVWLMATASYQTYMKCQMRQPSLEIQWALQAVSVPSGGLGLSLHSSSVHGSRLSFSQNLSQVWETKPFANMEEEDHKLNCCAECTSNYENEAQLFKSCQKKLLPPWLQQQSHSRNANQEDELVELRRKWNRLCRSLHQGRHTQSQFSSDLYNNQSLTGRRYSFASSYPRWPSSQCSVFPDSNSISFAESAMKPHNGSNSVAKFRRRQQSCSTIEFNFGNRARKPHGDESSLDSLKGSEGKEVKTTLALGNSDLSDSGKLQRSDLLKLLQENVPWQLDSIHSIIVEALVECKSSKKASWFLLQGNDTIGKRRLALSIAASVFGSADLLFHINMRERNDDDDMSSFSETLIRKLKNYEKLVVLVENIDFLADTQFMKSLADGFETGNFGQVIFVLTKGDSSNYEVRIKNQDSVINMTLKVDEKTHDFNHKRKAEWDFSTKIKKSPRNDEKEDAASVTIIENVNNGKRDLSRQSNFNPLDLNMKADDDDDEDVESKEKPGEFSLSATDLTRENLINPVLPNNGFLDLIQNSFVFNLNSSEEEGEITGIILSKMKVSFDEIFKGQSNVNFSVEERVLEEVVIGSGFFLNSLFEKWLKVVFQTSLEEAVKFGGKEEGIGIRICFGGKNDKMFANDGFGDSCLPKKIQIAKLD